MSRRLRPDERVVRIDGDLCFRVRSATAAPAPTAAPIVLIHGIGVSHRYFSRLHSLLALTEHVHSIDLPGFGGLPKPAGSPTVAEMSRALGQVLDVLGVQRAMLVGHSMGAQWAVELGAQRPDLASHVVAIGPVTDDEHRSMLAQSVALAVDALGEPPSGNVIVFSDYAFFCGVRWYLRQSPHMIRYRIEDRVRDLRQPLLVLRGENDPIAGELWCRRLRDNARAGSLQVIAGQRHIVHYTAPDAVASALRTFAQASSQIAGQ